MDDDGVTGAGDASCFFLWALRLKEVKKARSKRNRFIEIDLKVI
jgi:hypothetical protein